AARGVDRLRRSFDDRAGRREPARQRCEVESRGRQRRGRRPRNEGDGSRPRPGDRRGGSPARLRSLLPSTVRARNAGIRARSRDRTPGRRGTRRRRRRRARRGRRDADHASLRRRSLSELRLGLIGCGRIAERGYVPAALRARGIRLAAVADPAAERCARAAPGVPSFGGAAELLAARAADVLVLATPAAAHVPDAPLAAAAGVPTLVEKPPAPTAGEAAQLAAISPP